MFKAQIGVRSLLYKVEPFARKVWRGLGGIMIVWLQNNQFPVSYFRSNDLVSKLLLLRILSFFHKCFKCNDWCNYWRFQHENRSQRKFISASTFDYRKRDAVECVLLCVGLSQRPPKSVKCGQENNVTTITILNSQFWSV